MNTDIKISHSPTLGALAKALAAAQAELEDAKKDSVNPHFKNRYSSLGSVRAELKKVLPRHGFATPQTTIPHGDAGVCVVTWLLHESGEWLCGELFIPVSKRDAQGFGSALSYARRYALAAIVGITSDEDDDAEHAVKPTTNGKPETAKANKPESDAEEKRFAEAFNVAKTTDAIAKVSADVARSVQEGKLTAAARQRLVPLYEAAVSRISPPAVAS
jgi:hypothetical protein